MKGYYMRNIEEPIMEVNHFDLTRMNRDSMYRSHCVKCTDGALLVQRDQKTFELLEYDFCVMCGQRYKYLDIDKLKEAEGPISKIVKDEMKIRERGI